MGVTVHLYWITPDGNYYEGPFVAAGLLSEERKLAVLAAKEAE